MALRATAAPPMGAAAESASVQVEDTVGDTESGVHEKPFNPGWSVTVPLLVEVASGSAMASAVTALVSWTSDDASVVEDDAVKDTTATTPLEIAALLRPDASQVIDPAVLLQDTDLLAPVAADPAVTVAAEKSVVE